MQIMLVEDDTSVRQLLMRFLTSLGHEVTVRDSAEEALEDLQKKRFDVLMTDLRLPGMTGLDLLQRLGDSIAMKNILMTGDPTGLDEPLPENVDHLLLKPLRLDQIAGLIQPAE